MLLDTNILIEHLDAVPSVVSALAAYKESGEEFVISAISVTEVLSHEKLSAGDIMTIKEYLKTYSVILVDVRIAEMAAEFRRTYKLLTPDAIIVATAYVNGMRLATHDKKMQSVEKVTFVDL